MGNRAVISVGIDDIDPAIYLHNSGSVESVLAFLEAAKQLGAIDPANDGSYSIARLTQIIGNVFGGTYSLGITTVGSADTDNGDNGWYVIGVGFRIESRKFTYGGDARSEVSQLNEDELATYYTKLELTLEKNKPFF